VSIGSTSFGADQTAYPAYPFSVDDLADVGVDEGTHVADYGKSSKFSGKIEYVTIEQKK
jgi:hypothetical protein